MLEEPPPSISQKVEFSPLRVTAPPSRYRVTDSVARSSIG